MYALMIAAMMAMPPGGDRLPPGYVKPKPPLRETISKPLPPPAKSAPLPHPAPPKSWAKRHPFATGLMVGAGIMAVRNLACNGEWFGFCESGGTSSPDGPTPEPPDDDCLWGCGQ